MGKRILYVDDNVVMLDLIKLLLEKKGYEVLTAKNVDDALQVAEGASFCLMIIDVNLAGDSGLMLMNFMKENHKDVPVFLYSGGERHQDNVDKMLALGASKYVQKRSGAELVTAVCEACPLH